MIKKQLRTLPIIYTYQQLKSSVNGYFSPINYIMLTKKQASLFLFLGLLVAVHTQYCSSYCQTPNKANCNSTSSALATTGCTVAQCASKFFPTTDGGAIGCKNYFSTLQYISYQDLSNMTINWKISTVNIGITCPIKYRYGAVGNLYTYTFYKRLVGGDYMYRNIPITVAHYQIRFRFAISYIGAWSTRDSIWLHTQDGILSADYNLTYTCVPGPTTFFICDMVINGQNNVDCISVYQKAPLHNTSTMLFNFTFISGQTDSRVSFWNLYDFLIVAVKCDPSCATCYNSLSTACFSCADNYYLTPNNTCIITCPGSLYILPSPTNSKTGECVSACPQGYYLSGTTCTKCATGCLVCLSATLCTLYTPDPNYQNLWTKYLAVWIIIILFGIFLIIALIWRFCIYSKPIVPLQEAKMIQEQKVYEQRVSVNEMMQKQNDINFHIQDIDYHDNVMIDQNPRRRKRVEQDMFRTRQDF